MSHLGRLLDQPITVTWVPRSQIGDVIKVFGYYILRGLKASDLALDEFVEAVVNGKAWLGVAYQRDPFRPLGIWISDLRVAEEGHGFATVCGLSGDRLPLWMPKIEALVIDFAKMNDCRAVRFFGRAAYKALVDDLNIIGCAEDGRTYLFEKRIAA